MNPEVHDALNELAKCARALRKVWIEKCPLYCKRQMIRVLNAVDILIEAVSRSNDDE